MKRLDKKCAIGLLAIVAFLATSVGNSTEAQEVTLPVIYKVEIQYWYFDTPHYSWRTEMETRNETEARFFYVLALLAKQDGKLHEYFPDEINGRYIPVDVRLTQEIDWDSLLNFNFYPYLIW